MLDKIIILLGNSYTNNQEDLIKVLIDICKNEAMNFCHLDYYDKSLDTVVIKMVLQQYNRRGNEGVSGLSFSGVSQNFLTDYTDDVVRELKRHRKLVTC